MSRDVKNHHWYFVDFNVRSLMADPATIGRKHDRSTLITSTYYKKTQSEMKNLTFHKICRRAKNGPYSVSQLLYDIQLLKHPVKRRRVAHVLRTSFLRLFFNKKIVNLTHFQTDTEFNSLSVVIYRLWCQSM